MAEQCGKTIPDFEMRDMNEDRMKQLILSCINELNRMDVDEMTTFELGLLKKFCTNPPNRMHGIEMPEKN